MGISGLLPLLKDTQVKSHVADFRGKRVGVDGFVWLHRAAFSCAQELCMNSGTTRYLTFCLHRVRLFREFGVTPVVVLDGQSLPMKGHTDRARRQKRLMGKRKGLELLAAGEKKKAYEYFQQCSTVTPFMVYQFIKLLEKEGVEYIVAPYEADAQLAYLERVDYIDAVLTEDSDLLVFGCRTVLFKLDKFGSCVVIQRNRLQQLREFGGKFNELMFRRMCILAGCDYLPSIPRLGIKTALRYALRYDSLIEILDVAQSEGLAVPEGYATDFRKAELAFRHQRVYDPRKRLLDTLHPLNETDFGTAFDCIEDIIGPEIDANLAQGIAEGRINPQTLQPSNYAGLKFDPDGLDPEILQALTRSPKSVCRLELEKLLEALLPLPTEEVVSKSEPAGPVLKSRKSVKIELSQKPSKEAILRQWSQQRCVKKTSSFSSFFSFNPQSLVTKIKEVSTNVETRSTTKAHVDEVLGHPLRMESPTNNRVASDSLPSKITACESGCSMANVAHQLNKAQHTLASPQGIVEREALPVSSRASDDEFKENLTDTSQELRAQGRSRGKGKLSQSQIPNFFTKLWVNYECSKAKGVVRTGLLKRKVNKLEPTIDSKVNIQNSRRENFSVNSSKRKVCADVSGHGTSSLSKLTISSRYSYSEQSD